MSNDDKYPDERLHLFIDGELDNHDRAAFMEAICKDENLSNRVCELIQLKDAVGLAYDNPPAPASARSNWHAARLSRTFMNSAAAVVMMAVGAAGGWLLYPLVTGNGQDSIVATVEPVQEQEKIILHISKSDPRQFAAALDYVEKFLAEQGGNDQIDVVAHAGGLDVMRADVSPVRERILALMQKHDNVHFIACAGAIRMFQQKKGTKPVIIEGVGTDMTAFDHIVGRLQAGGWKYIKVESLAET
jgi:intracellular sulfur oxidation DsrE/DsrF family protein